MKNTSYILNRIIDNVGKVIIGKRETIELVVISLVCNGHVLIEDVPGVGKTSLVSALAKSIYATFKRIQYRGHEFTKILRECVAAGRITARLAKGSWPDEARSPAADRPRPQRKSQRA